MSERVNKSASFKTPVVCDDGCAFDYMQLGEMVDMVNDLGNYSWMNPWMNATGTLSNRGGGGGGGGGGASFNMQRVVQYVIAPMYLSLFTVGLVGNLWVISVIVQIFRTLKNAAINRHVLVYILSLSIVDTLVMVTIPLVATDMIVGSWIFGELLCRVNYALESINKVLSTFILTAVSWDRCMAICCPLRGKIHRTRTAVAIVIGCAVVAGALITPIHRNATVGSPGGANDSTVLKCHNNLAETEMRVFMAYIFVLGYCAPAVVMTVCYACMLARIYGHQRNLRSQSAVPFKKVTLSAMLVVSFYYVVWTPYWVCMMWFLVIGKPPHLTGSAILVLYFIHALPYVNSSINWVFYAFLNKALRQSHMLSLEMRRHSQLSRCSEIMTATNKVPSTTARTSIEYELMPVGEGGNGERNGSGFLSPHRPSY